MGREKKKKGLFSCFLKGRGTWKEITEGGDVIFILWKGGGPDWLSPREKERGASSYSHREEGRKEGGHN